VASSGRSWPLCWQVTNNGVDAVPARAAGRHGTDWFIITGNESSRCDRFPERNHCNSVGLITQGSGNGPYVPHDAYFHDCGDRWLGLITPLPPCANANEPAPLFLSALSFPECLLLSAGSLT
jgi:hypothetical protein